MPGYDKTGPDGYGPFTGRGRGIYSAGLNSILKQKRALGLITLAIPVVTAIINDVRKPGSFTRQFFNMIKDRITGISNKKSFDR